MIARADPATRTGALNTAGAPVRLGDFIVQIQSACPWKRLSFGEESVTIQSSMSQTQDNSDEDAGPAPLDPTGPPSRLMRIGDWDADFALNLLRRGQQAVHLEPKAMELLFFLAGHPGEVVSRDDLLAALWDGVVVGDDALTQAVIKLRKAFGDNPREPSYIQTVPKRGYRLIAQVGAPVPSGG